MTKQEALLLLRSEYDNAVNMRNILIECGEHEEEIDKLNYKLIALKIAADILITGGDADA